MKHGSTTTQTVRCNHLPQLSNFMAQDRHGDTWFVCNNCIITDIMAVSFFKFLDNLLCSGFSAISLVSTVLYENITQNCNKRFHG